MSRDRLTIAIAILAILGLLLAVYLTYVHYFGLQPLCLTNGGCETVQSSSYAIQFGIPVPVLGIIGYAIMLGSLWIKGEIGRLFGMVFSIGSFAFSMYLTYLELFKIHAICSECVTSAFIATLIACLMTARYLMSSAPAVKREPEAE